MNIISGVRTVGSFLWHVRLPAWMAPGLMVLSFSLVWWTEVGKADRWEERYAGPYHVAVQTEQRIGLASAVLVAVGLAWMLAGGTWRAARQRERAHRYRYSLALSTGMILSVAGAVAALDWRLWTSTYSGADIGLAPTGAFLIVVIVGLLGLAVYIELRSRGIPQRRRSKLAPSAFNTPPGWPTPPPGWVPPPGWRPDPSWPAAPDGWQFWAYPAPASPDSPQPQYWPHQALGQSDHPRTGHRADPPL